ncbi:MAG: hypothetical protein JNN07_22060 [Verrucomicrobiales bacterium]|nr:hypothetical protein [Verrucomicrobiales bacterium]
MKISRTIWTTLAFGAVLLLPVNYGRCQLAITEVMASASTNLGSIKVPQGPDFWELTNFGSEPADLSDFRFSDSVGLTDVFEAEDRAMFAGLQLGAGSSILFFQAITNVCTNATQFRAWWGETNIPAEVPIIPYTRRGFGRLKDAVQVWRVDESGTNEVDRVELLEARSGFSLVYDTNTGFMDTLSEVGVNRAIKAAQTDDVGSPGTAGAAVPVGFALQPQSLTVDAGAPAVLNVRTLGLPRPLVQWQFEGSDLAGETRDRIVLTNAEPQQAGRYTARIFNGLTSSTSEVAVVAVNTIPSAPTILSAPVDLVVTPWQTAIFQIAVRGYPLPVVQWRFEGQDIPGETGSVLRIPQADEFVSGVYSVTVSNQLGVAVASASLSVRPEPKLFITEMMGGRSTNSLVVGRSDWWELTNFDTDSVNLRGYRFDDFPRVLEGAWVITNDLVVRPGESVVFLQNMTPEFFTEWWGEENLPAGLQFVRYAGNGINAHYDSIALWNPTASDADDFITRSEYVHLDKNYVPIQGSSLSFWCDGRIEEGRMSQVGECGAIRAAKSADVASPGYYTNHPPRQVAPRLVTILHTEGAIQLTYTAQAGTTYEWLASGDLSAGKWTVIARQTAAGDRIEFKESTARGTSWRFYTARIALSSP